MFSSGINIILGTFLLSLLFFLLSCSDDSAGDGSRDTEDAINLQAFTNVISEVGIVDVGKLGQTAAWGDYNNDRCQDLFIANTDFDPPNVFLFKNNCDGTFSNVTQESGIFDIPLRSASWADFDNDGLLDLVVGTIKSGDPPKLYKNIEGSKFLDVSLEAGITKEGCTVSHTLWGDYDKDGFLDLIQSCLFGNLFLYHNEGNGKFNEVSKESGLKGESSKTNSALWIDINNDGFLDVFLANKGLNKLYLNSGNGTFKDISEKAGIKGDKSWRSVSVCAGDFNNDGFFDLYVGNIASSRNALYKNMKDGTFEDITVETQTGDIGDARTCSWVDFDGDGWIDIFTTNHIGPSKLFRNLGKGRFVDVAPEVGVKTPIDVFGASWGDYNNDSFPDVFLTGHIGNALMKNNGNSNNFVIISLIGDGVLTNRSAIGARVKITTSRSSQFRDVNGGKGASEQDMLPLTFGAGKAKKIDVLVKWPSGKECFFEDINIQDKKRVFIEEFNCSINQF